MLVARLRKSGLEATATSPDSTVSPVLNGEQTPCRGNAERKAWTLGVKTTGGDRLAAQLLHLHNNPHEFEILERWVKSNRKGK